MEVAEEELGGEDEREVGRKEYCGGRCAQIFGHIGNEGSETVLKGFEVV